MDLSDLVRKLTDEERQDLIDNLLALDPSLQEEIDAEWSLEIKQRIEQFADGKVVARPYEDMMADLRRRRTT